MKERTGPRTLLDAKAARITHTFIDDHRTSFRVNRKRTNGTGFHAGIVVTLCTEMRYFNAWKGHKDSNSRRLWPNPILMMKAANYFTPLTTSTANIISNNPNATHGTNPSLYFVETIEEEVI
jgi:hypothetical protein